MCSRNRSWKVHIHSTTPNRLTKEGSSHVHSTTPDRLTKERNSHCYILAHIANLTPYCSYIPIFRGQVTSQMWDNLWYMHSRRINCAYSSLTKGAAIFIHRLTKEKNSNYYIPANIANLTHYCSYIPIPRGQVTSQMWDNLWYIHSRRINCAYWSTKEGSNHVHSTTPDRLSKERNSHCYIPAHIANLTHYCSYIPIPRGKVTSQMWDNLWYTHMHSRRINWASSSYSSPNCLPEDVKTTSCYSLTMCQIESCKASCKTSKKHCIIIFDRSISLEPKHLTWQVR